MENRSMKRRNQKLDKGKIKNTTEETNEIITFAKVLGIVVICVLAIYFFTRIFVTKDLFNKDTKEQEEVPAASINYDVTILGSLLNRPYKEYYVIIYSKDNSRKGYYDIVVDNYRNKIDALKLYYADLSNPFNSSFYTEEESSYKASSIEDLKVKELTLIKVSDGKITEFIEDEKAIATELEP